LEEVLEALEFRPDGKDAKYLDIAHIAQYTAVLKDLFTNSRTDISDYNGTTTRKRTISRCH
jgi:hypothetical protein